MPRAAVAAETTSSVERSDARPPPIPGLMMLDLYVRSPPPRKRVPVFCRRHGVLMAKYLEMLSILRELWKPRHHDSSLAANTVGINNSLGLPSLDATHNIKDK